MADQHQRFSPFAIPGDCNVINPQPPVSSTSTDTSSIHHINPSPAVQVPQPWSNPGLVTNAPQTSGFGTYPGSGFYNPGAPHITPAPPVFTPQIQGYAQGMTNQSGQITPGFVPQIQSVFSMAPPSVPLTHGYVAPPGAQQPMDGRTAPPGVQLNHGSVAPTGFPLNVGSTAPPGVQQPIHESTAPPGVQPPNHGYTAPPGVQPPNHGYTAPPGHGFMVPSDVHLNYGSTAPPGVQPDYGSTAPPGVQPDYGSTAPPGVQPDYGSTAPPGVHPDYGSTAPPGVHPDYGSTAPPGVHPDYGSTAPPGVQHNLNLSQIPPGPPHVNSAMLPQMWSNMSVPSHHYPGVPMMMMPLFPQMPAAAFQHVGAQPATVQESVSSSQTNIQQQLAQNVSAGGQHAASTLTANPCMGTFYGTFNDLASQTSANFFQQQWLEFLNEKFGMGNAANFARQIGQTQQVPLKSENDKTISTCGSDFGCGETGSVVKLEAESVGNIFAPGTITDDEMDESDARGLGTNHDQLEEPTTSSEPPEKLPLNNRTQKSTQSITGEDQLKSAEKLQNQPGELNSEQDPPKARAKKRFKCGTCPQKFASVVTVKAHKKHCQHKFKCVDCQEFFSCKELHDEHVCKTQRTTRSTVSKHAQTASEGKHFVCGVCGRCLYNNGAYKLHLKQHNARLTADGVARKISCKKCQSFFSDMKCKRRHVHVCHNDVNLIKRAESMNKRRKATNYITPVTKSIRAKRFQCVLCDTICLNQGGLNSHMHIHQMRDQRGMKKKYSCTNCKAYFSTKSAMLKHLNKHHHSNTGNIDNDNGEKTRKPPFITTGVKCRICQKKCANRSSLKRHAVVHLSRDPWSRARKKFTCHVCRSFYMYDCDLRKHNRVVHQILADSVRHVKAKTPKKRKSPSTHTERPNKRARVLRNNTIIKSKDKNKCKIVDETVKSKPKSSDESEMDADDQINTADNAQERFPCQRCNQLFETNLERLRHHWSHHIHVSNRNQSTWSEHADDNADLAGTSNTKEDKAGDEYDVPNTENVIALPVNSPEQVIASPVISPESVIGSPVKSPESVIASPKSLIISPVKSTESVIESPVSSPKSLIISPVKSTESASPSCVSSPESDIDSPESNIDPPESDIDSPVNSPESDIDSPVNSPESDIDSPVNSPESDIDSPVSSSESDIDSPVSSPESVIDSPVNSPESNIDSLVNSPESDIDSPVSSPESVIDSPLNSPESDIDSPEVNIDSPVSSPKSSSEGLIASRLSSRNNVITSPLNSPVSLIGLPVKLSVNSPIGVLALPVNSPLSLTVPRGTKPAQQMVATVANVDGRASLLRPSLKKLQRILPSSVHRSTASTESTNKQLTCPAGLRLPGNPKKRYCTTFVPKMIRYKRLVEAVVATPPVAGPKESTGIACAALRVVYPGGFSAMTCAAPTIPGLKVAGPCESTRMTSDAVRVAGLRVAGPRESTKITTAAVKVPSLIIPTVIAGTAPRVAGPIVSTGITCAATRLASQILSTVITSAAPREFTMEACAAQRVAGPKVPTVITCTAPRVAGPKVPTVITSAAPREFTMEACAAQRVAGPRVAGPSDITEMTCASRRILYDYKSNVRSEPSDTTSTGGPKLPEDEPTCMSDQPDMTFTGQQDSLAQLCKLCGICEDAREIAETHSAGSTSEENGLIRDSTLTDPETITIESDDDGDGFADLDVQLPGEDRPTTTSPIMSEGDDDVFINESVAMDTVNEKLIEPRETSRSLLRHHLLREDEIAGALSNRRPPNTQDMRSSLI